MRGTKAGILVLILAILSPGCALFESGVKATSGAVLDGVGAMLEAKLPDFAAGIVETGKGVAKSEIEKATVGIIEKSHKAGQWFFIHAMDLAGIRAMDYDADGDGILGPAEVDAAKKAAKDKQEKDAEEGKQSLMGYILAALGLAGGGLGSTWIKSFFRWKDKRLAEKIANGKTTPNE